MLNSPDYMTVVVVRKRPYGVQTFENCTNIECHEIDGSATYSITVINNLQQEVTHNFVKSAYLIMII